MSDLRVIATKTVHGEELPRTLEITRPRDKRAAYRVLDEVVRFLGVEPELCYWCQRLSRDCDRLKGE